MKRSALLISIAALAAPAHAWAQAPGPCPVRHDQLLVQALKQSVDIVRVPITTGQAPGRHETPPDSPDNTLPDFERR
jgi:hypothetical protein